MTRMSRARVLTSWLTLIAGIIACDVANDDYWLELLAGVLFLAHWMILAPWMDAE